MISRKEARKEYYHTNIQGMTMIDKIYDSIGSCETCLLHGKLLGKDRTSEDMCFIFKTETHNSFYCKAYEEK